MKVRVKLVDGAKLPIRGSEQSTGYDLTAVSIKKETEQYIMYDTGVQVQSAYANTDLQIRPRSSVYKTGMVMANSVGTVDVDYTGNLYVTFYKVFGDKSTPYEIGDRIAQLIFSEFQPMTFVDEEFVDTKRGDGGHGSTGK